MTEHDTHSNEKNGKRRNKKKIRQRGKHKKHTQYSHQSHTQEIHDKQVRKKHHKHVKHPHNQKRNGPKASIPKNWKDVSSIGKLLPFHPSVQELQTNIIPECQSNFNAKSNPIANFLPMRTLLDEKFSCNLGTESNENFWMPATFLKTQEVLGYNVKLLIDLTNTFKYYDGKKVFDNTGVEYVKFSIEGFNRAPKENEVNKFISIVDTFLQADKKTVSDSSDLVNEIDTCHDVTTILKENTVTSIAVHCTHGLNRTGYLIVSYLIRRSGYSVTEALLAFRTARPPGIIKHLYIEDLFRLYGKADELLALPELPAWAEKKYSNRRR